MNFSDFANWCNTYSSVIQIILSLLTLLISVIAIFISIMTSRLPYKKRVLVKYGSYFGIGYDDEGIHVTITNVGNRPSYINDIGLSVDKKMRLISKESFGIKNKKIGPGESETVYLSKPDILVYKKSGKRIYAFYEDNEGMKKYKYISKLNNLFK